MTNDDIKEAARLVDEIERLEGIIVPVEGLRLARLSDESRHHPGGYVQSLMGLSAADSVSIVGLLLALKKARLNDLRAGC